MKYIEYIYLAAAVVLLGMLVEGFEKFTSFQRIALIVAIGVVSFMFSFRRKQRVAFEKIEEDRIQELEKEMEEEEDV